MVQNQKFKNIFVRFLLVFLMSGNISAFDWSWMPLIGGYFRATDTIQRVAQGNLQDFGGVDLLVEQKDHSGKCALGGAAVGVMSVAAFDKFGVNLGDHVFPVAAGVAVASGASGFLAGKLWFWWKREGYNYKRDMRLLRNDFAILGQTVEQLTQENRELHQRAEQQRQALFLGVFKLYGQGRQTQLMVGNLAKFTIAGFQANREEIARNHAAIVHIGEEGVEQRGAIFVQIDGVMQQLNVAQEQLRAVQGAQHELQNQVRYVQAALPELQTGAQAAQETNTLIRQLLSRQIVLPQQSVERTSHLALDNMQVAEPQVIVVEPAREVEASIIVHPPFTTRNPQSVLRVAGRDLSLGMGNLENTRPFTDDDVD